MSRPCPVKGCKNTMQRGRYCGTHYTRLRKHGDVNYERPKVAPLDRFHGHYRVDESTGCWVWKSALDSAGYGLFQIGQKTYRAHRWGYQQMVGPVAADLHMDHLCRNPPCVNPEHLEPVTPRVNTIVRGMGANAIRHREAKCIAGHDVTGDNLYVPPSNPTWRQCKECTRRRTRENQRIRRARQKESA